MLALCLATATGATAEPLRGLAIALAQSGSVSEEFREALARFYARRDYEPLWFEGLRWTARSAELQPVLDAAAKEGLDPQDYALRDLYRHCASRAMDPVSCELRTSDTLLRYARDVGYGRLRAEDMDPNWHMPQQDLPVPDLLAAVEAADDLTAVLERLPPPHAAYRKLRTALAEYRHQMAGRNWPAIPDGPSLRPGDRDERVTPVRERLALVSPALQASTDPTRFDALLESAVRDFQARHGLDTDGIVGRQTVAALNVLPAERIIQIRLNMERWRWMPRELGPDHVLVNLAGFELTLAQAGEPGLRLRAIGGRPDRTSPAFHSSIRRLVINPDWTVPRRLAVEDMLPQLRRDPLAMQRKGIQVLSSRDGEFAAVDPTRIAWRDYHKENFPFVLRQEPGPHNSLGRIKFDMPNPFSVFLHDTPARELFNKSERTLSSGCIRVDRPFELAARLLGGDAETVEQSLVRMVDRGDTQHLTINPPVPVYLVYLTAWVDDAGVLQFRSDVYGRNVRMRDWFSLQ